MRALDIDVEHRTAWVQAGVDGGRTPLRPSPRAGHVLWRRGRDGRYDRSGLNHSSRSNRAKPLSVVANRKPFSTAMAAR